MLTRIYQNSKQQYFRSIKITSWLLNNSGSDSYDKNVVQEKVNVLVGLHEAMQEKLKTASYSEPIHILTSLPDKWSWVYCSEYLNIFEYLVCTSHEIKKIEGMLAKPALKKGKAITTENLHQKFLKLAVSIGRCLKRQTMVVWVKEYISKNFATCKSLCNLQEFYIAFKEKHPNVKYWVLKILCLETQMAFSDWPKNDSLCLHL